MDHQRGGAPRPGYWPSPGPRAWSGSWRHPDFACAWLTRLFFVSSQAMATGYLVFVLQDAIGFERIFPGRSATDGVVVITVVYTAALFATRFELLRAYERERIPARHGSC